MEGDDLEDAIRVSVGRTAAIPCSLPITEENLLNLTVRDWIQILEKLLEEEREQNSLR